MRLLVLQIVFSLFLAVIKVIAVEISIAFRGASGCVVTSLGRKLSRAEALGSFCTMINRRLQKESDSEQTFSR